MSIHGVSLSLETTLNQKKLLSISVSEELNEVVKVYKTSNPKFSMSVADGNHFGIKHLAFIGKCVKCEDKLHYADCHREIIQYNIVLQSQHNKLL